MIKEWMLFPCRWDGTHKPLVNWATESSSDPEVHRKWKEKWPDAYLCVATKQSNITIVDVDIKNGKQGDDALFDLEMEYSALPKTLEVSTPSGGKHFYFEGATANTVEKLGSGLDTPVMAPVPGSLVPDKGLYEITQSVPVAPLPSWIEKLVGASRERDENQHIPAIELDQPHNITSAANLLTQAPRAMEGESGDALTYQTACNVRDLGISEDLCLDLMLQFWNLDCVPPWSVDELATKVANAYNYALSQAGAGTPEANFTPVPFGSLEGVPAHISAFEGEAPVRDWVIQDWLPQGEITSLYGAGGIGKSLLSIQLALAVACGGKFLGLPIAKKRPVLVVACEDTEQELHRRVGDIRRNPSYSFLDYSSDIFFWSRAGKDAILARADRNIIVKGPFYDILIGILKDMKAGPKLLILDTLADFFAGSENDRAMVNYFVKVVLGGIMKEYEVDILLLGHPAKADGSEYSGSTAWNNAVRTRLTLTANENKNLGDYRVLSRSKSNYAKAGEEIHLHWDRGVFEPIDQDGIIDEDGEINKGILLTEITEQAEKNQPYGFSNASKFPIMGVKILGANGKSMSKDTIKSFIYEMQKNELIKIISGQKQGNGIWPVYAEEVEDG